MSLFVIMFNNLLSFQRHKIAFNTDIIFDKMYFVYF